MLILVIFSLDYYPCVVHSCYVHVVVFSFDDEVLNKMISNFKIGQNSGILALENNTEPTTTTAINTGLCICYCNSSCWVTICEVAMFQDLGTYIARKQAHKIQFKGTHTCSVKCAAPHDCKAKRLKICRGAEYSKVVANISRLKERLSSLKTFRFTGEQVACWGKVGTI